MVDRILVIGGSAGSFRIIQNVVKSLPASFPVPVVICVHRLKNIRTGFIDTLAQHTPIRVEEPFHKQAILPGAVYIAPSNYHLLIDPAGHFTLSTFKPVNHSRPSIDLTMKTAARACLSGTVGVLLTGANYDGAAGMHTIHEAGGITVVQDPETAEIPTMPNAALDIFRPHHVLPADKIITFIQNLPRL